MQCRHDTLIMTYSTTASKYFTMHYESTRNKGIDTQWRTGLQFHVYLLNYSKQKQSDCHDHTLNFGGSRPYIDIAKSAADVVKSPINQIPYNRETAFSSAIVEQSIHIKFSSFRHRKRVRHQRIFNKVEQNMQRATNIH